MSMNHEECALARLYIESHSVPVSECGCWLWEINEDHGCIDFNGHTEQLDELSFEAFKGPIPNGVKVTHQCHLTSCINPDHLKVFSQEPRKVSQ